MTRGKYPQRVITEGVSSLPVIGLGTLLTGEPSGYEAKVLMKSSPARINTLSNQIILAPATVPALLLTVPVWIQG